MVCKLIKLLAEENFSQDMALHLNRFDARQRTEQINWQIFFHFEKIALRFSYEYEKKLAQPTEFQRAQQSAISLVVQQTP